MTAAERRILIVTCFGHFMSHFNVLVFPAVALPLASKLDMDLALVLGMSFWQYLLFGLSALPWGIAGDKWGGKPLMGLMFLGGSLFAFTAALAIDSPTWFPIALAGVGLFAGIYHPIGLGLISKSVRRLPLAMGYNAMFGGLGLVAAPLVAGLATWFYGPAAAYTVACALNAAGLLMMGWLRMADQDEAHAAKDSTGNGMLAPFAILLVAMMLGGIVYRGATVLLPAYMQLKGQAIVHGLSSIAGSSLSPNLVATMASSFVYLVGVFGQYTGGLVGDRWDNRYLYLLFHVITIPAVILMAYTTNIPLVGCASVYVFFLLGMQPIENTLVARITPARLHHSAYGMKFILTFGVGALAVKMVERIDMAWGVEATFLALGLISIALVGSILVLIRLTDSASVEAPA